MKQRKRISKAISLITSILLIVLGILALVARDNFSWALGIISGVFLIAVGVVSIIYAVVIKKMILGSGWLIIQGILAIVLGVVLCTIQDATLSIIYLVVNFTSWCFIFCSWLTSLHFPICCKQHGCYINWFVLYN